MKYRLDHVILTSPFTVPAEMIQGRSKDGNLSAHDGFLLDRIENTLCISHTRCVAAAAKTGKPVLVKTLPWTAVDDSTVAEEQPEWSDWGATEEMLYPEAFLKPEPAAESKPEAPTKPDGRSKEARAAKAQAVAT